MLIPHVSLSLSSLANNYYSITNEPTHLVLKDKGYFTLFFLNASSYKVYYFCEEFIDKDYVGVIRRSISRQNIN